MGSPEGKSAPSGVKAAIQEGWGVLRCRTKTAKLDVSMSFLECKELKILHLS